MTNSKVAKSSQVRADMEGQTPSFRSTSNKIGNHKIALIFTNSFLELSQRGG